MAVVIGIDLGTTFSAVATLDETGRPYIVPNNVGANITASCVVGRGPGVMEVGEYARRQWGNAPETAAGRFKRDMGTSTTFAINGEAFTPTQLSALVLKRLVADTEQQLGPISEAVITIPANFAHEAREATLAAASAANLSVKYIINEPTAAALCYAFKSGQALDGAYAVYDLGGGTFDISIIRVSGQEVETLATNGIVRLGGDDFDVALQKIVRDKFLQQTGKELEADEFTKNDAEAEKKSLSHRKQVTVRVGRKLVDVKRIEFEEAISPLITQAEMMCEATLEEAAISLANLKGVFLAGGGTRMPLVAESVERVFRQAPIATVDVDEVVALGAALYAAYKNPSLITVVQKGAIDAVVVKESTSKCFGTLAYSYDSARDEQREGNEVLIKKGDRIPAQVTRSLFTMHDGQILADCSVTESTTAETDPRFVKIIWTGQLDLPPGRPAQQQVDVTFAYDENQVMRCSFLDVASGVTKEIDLSMTSASTADLSAVDRFLVE